MMEYFVRLNDIKQDVSTLYETGITRGVYLGFECLHELYSMKPGGTTYIYSAPFSGKTEFWFDIMVYLSNTYGWRHAVYSPESGTAKEIYAELISKQVQKPFYKNSFGFMNEVEMQRAADFVHEYFIVIDPKDKDLTIETFYEQVKNIEQVYDIKINTTCCDPFNELKHDLASDSGRQDLYIENKLGFIRRDAISNNRHNAIITHCTDQQAVVDKSTGKSYYPPPSPRQIAGGQAWYRKAMNLICSWRPPEWMIDPDTGAPFKENEVHIIINKYKPKGVGKKGMCKLYFDTKKNRYYEILNGQPRYAGKQHEAPAPDLQYRIITPNPAAEKENYPF